MAHRLNLSKSITVAVGTAAGTLALHTAVEHNRMAAAAVAVHTHSPEQAAESRA